MTGGGRILVVSQTAIELLRLLAEDAPASELERQASRIAEDDAALGETARTLALQVRAVLDARRRREAELSALVDTARDLASMRDTGGVLDAIVRRARALLGTDVAYLTLHDPDLGDTFMRATDGSVSARFQNLRLPLGAGLGGLVAQTMQPYWTTDYPADERFRHTHSIDDAVAEEGLIAICGVPLLVDGEFVGVLFASNRSRRPFSHDEVSLLASLAALAAVSLVQTRAAAETAGALAALSAAHETVRRQAATTERAAAAHDRFAELVLGGGGITGIAAALTDLLDGWVVVLDSAGRRTAEQGPAPSGGRDAPLEPDPLVDDAAVRTSQASDRLAHDRCTWAVAVSAAGERMGTLVLGGRESLDAGDQRTLERAAMVTALVLLFRRQAAEAEQRVRTDLLTDLLSHTGHERAADAEGLTARARLLGLDLTSPHVLAVCRPVSTRNRRGLAMTVSTAVHASQDGGPGLVAEHSGDVLALVPGDDASAVARRLWRRVRGAGDGGAVTVGAAGPVHPLVGLQECRAEARRTVAALVALGTPDRAAAAADLGFAGLVVGDAPDVASYVDRLLGPVLEYDGRRGSDLAGTLEAYFATGGSPSRAALALHVHTNTVAQRLERVSSLLGASWSEPEPALDIQLALRLRRLRSGS